MNYAQSSLATKFVAGVTAVVMTMTAFVGFAPTAQAAETDALCAVVADLQAAGNSNATLDALAATVCGDDSSDDSSSTAGAGQYVHHPAVDFEFTRNLYIGSRGNDVKMLQMALNANADTQVAVSGAGSPGNETEYFGPATRAAVVKFQVKTGVTPALGYFYPLTRAEMNRKEAGNPTEPSTPSNDGDLNVSEGDNPSDDLFPEGVVRFPITAFELDGEADVESITVRYNGDADEDDIIDSVVILDEDMNIVGDAESLNSDEEAEIDVDLEVDGTVMLYVAVNATSGGTAFDDNDGLDFTFDVVEIEADGDVDGLPVSGAEMTVQDNIDLGNVEVAVNHVSDSAMEIGSEEEEFVTVNIDANPDDNDDSVFVKTFRLENIGDGDLDDLDNIYVEVDNDEFDAEIDGDYIVFNFGNGFELEEGDDEDFEVYADVVGGATDEFQFVLSEATDMYVEAESGYGMPLDSASTVDESGYATVDADTVTISAGSASLSTSSEDEKEEITAGEVLLGQFDFEIEGEGLIVEDMVITIAVTDAVANSGDDDDILLENVYIADADGNEISEMEDAEWSVALVGGAGEMEVEFDEIEFPEGDHEDLRIMAELSDEVAHDTKYQVVDFDGSTEFTGDIVGDESDEDISVGGSANFSEQTVAGAILEVKMTGQDDDETSDDVEGFAFAVLELDATDGGEDVDVTEVTLTLAATVATLDAEEDVTNCALYDGDDRVSDEFDLEGGEAEYDIDLDGVTVEADADDALELELRCDIADNDLMDGDTFEWSITATGVNSNDEVEAESANGTDGEDFVVITASASDLVTIKAATLEVLEADENPDASVVKTGTSKVTILAVEVESDNGTATIDDMTLTLTTLNGDEVDGNDVEIWVDGDDKVDTVDMTAGTETVTGLNIEIEEDTPTVIEFVVDIDTAAADAGTIVISLDDVVLEDGGDVNGGAYAAIASNVATVFEGVPVIEMVSENTNDLNLGTNSDYEIFEFSIEADGEDVYVDSVTLDVTTFTNIDAITDATLEVYKNSAHTGTEVEEVTVAITTTGDTLYTFANDVKIDQGDTYYFVLVGDVTPNADPATLTVELAEDAAVGVQFVDDLAAPTITSSEVMEDDMVVTHSYTD